jgi:hypothetical protein
MSDQYCASCDEIKSKCKFLQKEDIVFEMQGTNLVLKHALTGSLLGSVSASSLCVALTTSGCSLGGGGGLFMTPDQIATSICSSASAQAALGACLRDDVSMSGAEIANALCADQAAVNALSACITDEVLTEIINNATRLTALAGALDSRITSNLQNDFVPLTPPSNGMLFLSNGAGTGSWVSTTDFLSYPPNVAIICDVLKSSACAGLSSIRATFNWCAEVNDPSQRMIPQIIVYSDTPATVYLQQWNGAAWANALFDDNIVASTATSLTAGAPPGSIASGVISRNSNYIMVTGTGYFRLFDGTNSSRVFNVNMASGSVCPNLTPA